MEDATVAVLDFRNNLSEQIAAQAPAANSFFGVRDSFCTSFRHFGAQQHLKQRLGHTCSNTLFSAGV